MHRHVVNHSLLMFKNPNSKFSIALRNLHYRSSRMNSLASRASAAKHAKQTHGKAKERGAFQRAPAGKAANNLNVPPLFYQIYLRQLLTNSCQSTRSETKALVLPSFALRFFHFAIAWLSMVFRGARSFSLSCRSSLVVTSRTSKSLQINF